MVAQPTIKDENLRLILSKGHGEWLAHRRRDLVAEIKEAKIGAALSIGWLVCLPVWFALFDFLTTIEVMPQFIMMLLVALFGFATFAAPLILAVAVYDLFLNTRRLKTADQEAADHATFLAKYNRA